MIYTNSNTYIYNITIYLHYIYIIYSIIILIYIYTYIYIIYNIYIYIISIFVYSFLSFSNIQPSRHPVERTNFLKLVEEWFPVYEHTVDVEHGWPTEIDELAIVSEHGEMS
jgi:hypothetical protein